MKLLGVEGSEQVEGKASGGIGSASETNVFPPPVANPASGDCLHVYMWLIVYNRDCLQSWLFTMSEAAFVAQLRLWPTN